MSLWIGNKEVGLAPGQTAGDVGGVYVERPTGTDTSKPYYVTESQDALWAQFRRNPEGLQINPNTGQIARLPGYKSNSGIITGASGISTPGMTAAQYNERQQQAAQQRILDRIPYASGAATPMRRLAATLPGISGLYQNRYVKPPPKRTFNVIEGRVSTEYRKTYPSSSDKPPFISTPLQDFGKNIFGFEQGLPQAGKTYRKSWFGSYIEVSPQEAKTVSKPQLAAIKTSDTYAPYLVVPGVFSSTSMLRGASLNIKMPNIKTPTISKILSKGAKVGKSEWENSLNMLRDESAGIGGRKPTVADRKTPFSMPTKEDIFGKPKTTARPTPTPKETIGGYARTWTTRAEEGYWQGGLWYSGKEPTPVPDNRPTWWEAYDTQRTTKKMYTSIATRMSRGLPTLKSLRYPRSIIRINRPTRPTPNIGETIGGYARTWKTNADIGYWQGGLWYSGQVKKGANVNQKPSTTSKVNISPAWLIAPKINWNTALNQQATTKQNQKNRSYFPVIPKVNIPSSHIPAVNIPSARPPKTPPKQPSKTPPRERGGSSWTPPEIPRIRFPRIKIPAIKIQSGDFSSSSFGFKPKKTGIRYRTIRTRMLSLADILGVKSKR